jgi:hypothetical protein
MFVKVVTVTAIVKLTEDGNVMFFDLVAVEVVKVVLLRLLVVSLHAVRADVHEVRTDLLQAPQVIECFVLHRSPLLQHRLQLNLNHLY